MAMLPEINVLAQPTAAAPRYRVAPHQPSPAAQPQGHAQPKPGQPNFVLRRLGVVLAVVATTIVSVVGIGSAGADHSVSVGHPAATMPASAAEPATTTVIVQPGDTLWTIAERVAPEVDRRKAVDELAKIAGGSMLEVGQRLEIPAVFG